MEADCEKEERKALFSEEKKQETFASAYAACR
jgi:hypothetical protein